MLSCIFRRGERAKPKTETDAPPALRPAAIEKVVAAKFGDLSPELVSALAHVLARPLLLRFQVWLHAMNYIQTKSLFIYRVI